MWQRNPASFGSPGSVIPRPTAQIDLAAPAGPFPRVSAGPTTRAGQQWSDGNMNPMTAGI